MVLPTGNAMSDAGGRWASSESDRAIRTWRSLFRGEARVKKDIEITDADIAASNLILWGDPSSNAILARILAKLPLEWTPTRLAIGKETCNAQGCMPVMIYPNPLNPDRYIVLNSGPTFREDSNGTNSLQTPRLPDAALIDLSEPPGVTRPGKVVWAGFFNESWR